MNSSVSKWSNFLLPPRGKIWGGVLLFHLLVSAGIGWYFPQVLDQFYKWFGTGPSLWYSPAPILFGLFLLEYINRIGYQVATYKFAQNVLDYLRTDTYSRWLSSELKIKRKGKSTDDFPMGEVLARVMNDTDAVRELVTSGSISIFIDMTLILFSLFGFLKLNHSLGLWLFGFEVVVCLGLVYGSRKMAVVFMEVRQSTGVLSRVMSDITNGLQELFFIKHDSYASKRGNKASEDFLKKQLKANIWDASYYSVAESLYPIILAMIFLVIPTQRGVEIALLAVLLDLIQKSITPIKDIAGKISNIQRAKTGVERIYEFHQLFEAPSSVEVKRINTLNTIEVRLNKFSYTNQEQELFSVGPLSFSSQRGALIGIVGESGSGKSTVLKLLSGLYGEFDGEIILDQKIHLNCKSPKDLKELSQYVSLVSQDSHVFSETLKFNLTLGEVDDARFNAFWIKVSDSLDYIKTWNITPETKINPKLLSMGQKQLLAALRACYLQKSIILFDEISSGLDSSLEKALRDLVQFLQQQAITITVSHRLESIRLSHELLLMDQGKVVGQGSVASLSANNDLFKNFIHHLH